MRLRGGSSVLDTDCVGLRIVANGGAARQVDYKVTVNKPFQLHPAKLHVVFISVRIVFRL